jgi:SAM-dependent methyltransferase
VAANWYRITPAARRALTEHTAYDGRRVTVTTDLPEATWGQVKAVLERLGGVYVAGRSAWDLDAEDAHAVVARALAAGRVMAPANGEGYVPTPVDLAAEVVCRHAVLDPVAGRELRILEPSAGTGRLVRAILGEVRTRRYRLTAVEPDPRRAARIAAHPQVDTVVAAFEDFAAGTGDRFDLVVMNPPFTVPGRAHLWAEHLLLAWRLLAPGGRLVAILPAGALDDDVRGRDPRAVRGLVRDNGEGERLPADAFAESGIAFGTCVVWLDAPLRDRGAPGGGTPARPAFRLLPVPSTGPAPLPVARPLTTRAAARTSPVQVWSGGWGGERVLRYRGDCAGCGRPCWAFDDGGNDVRGALGPATLVPMGPDDLGGDDVEVPEPVARCGACWNDATATDRVRDVARAWWVGTAQPTAGTTVGTAVRPGPSPAAGCEQLALFTEAA